MADILLGFVVYIFVVTGVLWILTPYADRDRPPGRLSRFLGVVGGDE